MPAIVHASPFDDVVLRATPLTEFVLRLAQVVPDRVALMDGPTGRSITYGELDDQIHRLAGGLAAPLVPLDL